MKKIQSFHEIACYSLKKIIHPFRIMAIVMTLGILQLNAIGASLQQQLKISGTVIDVTTGQVMPGVNIQVKGTTIGTITDANGKYSLSATEPNAILIFSFIGYVTQEVPVAGKNVIDIGLQSEVTGLEEVVVIGYGTQKKIDLTGAVAFVKSEDIVKVPSINISSTLRGEVPGLLIQQSVGAPGMETTKLSIRGFGNPLVLVDGVEMSWERIDPNDIASISVLKDASAAIYGSKAGNGVILITTKRGEAGEIAVNYDGSISFQNPTFLPDFVDSWKYAQLLREGEFFQGLSYTYTEEDVQKFKEGGDPKYPNTDWYNEIFSQWTPMQSHNISAQGSEKKINYFISVGYLDQNSLFKSGDLEFNRYNARSNIDAKIKDNLSISLDFSYINEIRDQTQSSLGEIWTDLYWCRPEYPADLPDPELGCSYAGFDTRNPKGQTYKKYTGFIDDRRENLSAALSINYKIPVVKGLEVNAKLNYLKRNEYKKTQDRPFAILKYDYDSKTYIPYGYNGNNKLDETSGNFREFFPRLSFNYQRTFRNHSVKGLLVGEWRDSQYNYLSAGKVDLLSLEIPYLFAGAIDNTVASGYRNEQGYVSYIGRVDYNYKEKYLFETSFRSDASYKFPTESRWGFFPSFSAGWRLSQEAFMRNLTWLDNLKLRMSYSKTGDDNVSAYGYLSGYNIRTAMAEAQLHEVYVFGSQVNRLIAPTSIANKNITWLNMTVYNLGLDASFLNNLIGLEFDAFYRIVEDIFGEPVDKYPSTFGATLPQLNLNSTDNRGFDLKLTHKNVIGGDFSYSIIGNFLFTSEKYRDWVEKPYTDPDEIRIYQKEGHNVNKVIGYVSDGIFMSQEEIDNHPVNQDEVGNVTLMPGDIKYKDLNNDGKITWRDQKEIGYSTFPEINFGLSFNMQYKGLSFSALFEGASMFNHYIQYFPFNNFSKPMEIHWKYSWRPDPNDPSVNKNPDARLPAILGDGTGRNYNNEKRSDFWMQDATYVRLKKLNASYSLPRKWIQTIGFKDLRISISATNIITLSKLGIYKNTVDPEAVNMGTWSYPPVKTISLGINLTI